MKSFFICSGLILLFILILTGSLLSEWLHPGNGVIPGPSSIANRSLSEHYTNGMLFGIITGLACYNLALFILIRNRAYYLFATYSIFVALYLMHINGYSLALIWQAIPEWDRIFSWVLLALLLIFFLRFTQAFLQTRKQHPPGHAALNTLMLLLATVAAVGVVFRRTGYLLNSLLAMIALFVVSWLALHCWIKLRDHHARAYIIANISFCAGGICYALYYLGIYGNAAIAALLVQAGVVAQQILFSAAVAEQFNAMQRERMNEKMRQEQYKHQLADQQRRELAVLVEEKTAALQREKEETERLLYNILPAEVAKELKGTGLVEPRRHDEVSILFTDFINFTNTVATIPAANMVHELNVIFKVFDDLIDQHGLEKIKTIGDAYMIAGGLTQQQPNHASACVRLALNLQHFIEQRNEHAAIKWRMRTGIHTGAVVAGVVGKKKFTYDLWGDTVNIANRMETASAASRVNVSAYTYYLIKDHFICEYRGKIDVKGKGPLDMYFVQSPKTAKATS